MAKKNRNAAPKPPNESARSHATAPTSKGSNFVTKAKAALKRVRNKVLPKTVSKEVTTHNEPTGTIVDGQETVGSAADIRGGMTALHPYDPHITDPTLDAAGDEGSPALPHQQNESASTIGENVLAAVHQTSDVGPSSGGVPVKGVRNPSAISAVLSGHDQPSHNALGDIQDADEKLLTIKSIPATAETTVKAIGLADTAMIQLDTINTTYLRPLSIFNTVASGIANIHPYAQVALSALTAASKVILSQANLDASIADLISRIKQTYELILQNKSPSRTNSMKDILVQIAQVIKECTQFILSYSQTKSFWGRLGRNVLSETATMVANYNSKLDNLMQDLRDRAVLNIHDSVQRIEDNANLDSLACAGRVGLNRMKKCLDGTRTEILNEILDWINNTDAATPRIFWLHGQAGKGKSAIAHTIALQAKNLGNLGSCFCFSRVRQHEELHMKLFATIARDLADRDLRFRLRLAEVIANDRALRDTEDIVEQWQKFIAEPLSQLEGSSTRNVVIVIDALDESGVDATREGILDVFATHGAELPINIRILLTSRPLLRIRKSLHSKQHIFTRSMDEICLKSATRDITLYISTRLKQYDSPFSDSNYEQLAAMSGGLFEWARLACDFVRPAIGVIPMERYHKIISRAGEGSNLLDEMYATFLRVLIQGSMEVLNRFRSVMRQILWSKEPLPIGAMDAMRREFSQENDHYSVRIVLDFMASFLTGTTETSVPVRPLHASFYDFLLDAKRSEEFFVDQHDIHRNLALASLHVMQSGLRFNICALPTSYVRNSDMVDLPKRVEENILSHLLYCCRFWATHLQEVEFDSDLAECVRLFVTGEKLLFWMEALEVSKFIGEAYRALTSAERWLQGKTKHEDALMFIKDGIKFISNFAGVIGESTPHLYLSALPFCPVKSTLARGISTKLMKMAEVVERQHEDWPRNQHTLKGHTGLVLSVAFSPDGRHIVSGSNDKTIQIWDAQTGGQVGKPLQGHTDSVMSVAFSPDGRYIVSGSDDKTIQIWDAQTGGQVGKPLQGHTDSVMSVAFSPDGRYIVSGSHDHTI
ncbi:hypothetical protein V8B97DRAFT_2067943 [Scleroderma yunnanense]